MKKTGSILAAALLLPVCGQTAEPMPEDARLRFEQSLYVQETKNAKIFAETRAIKYGETMWKIFREDYGVSPELMPELTRTFTEINPGVDPNKLRAGQVVKVPFKIEKTLGSEPPPKPAPSDAKKDTYTVKPGDSMWKILSKAYGVGKFQMKDAFSAVAKANSQIKDLGQLLVGQVLNIPSSLFGKVAVDNPPQANAQAVPEKKEVPDYFYGVNSFLETLSCRVEKQGQIFLPVERGKTVSLEMSDFPVVEGPTGKKLILDPKNRLSASLMDSVKASWGYETIQGSSSSAELHLAALLPRLGFYELNEGERPFALGGGLKLLAQTRWNLVTTNSDFWKNKIHLVFSKDKHLDPALATLAMERGLVLHRIEVAGEIKPEAYTGPKPPEMDYITDAAGLARFLDRLGVKNEEGGELTFTQANGVEYKVKPLLTFEHKGSKYAVPPKKPANAASILEKGGYFTFDWAQNATALARLGDLLSLINVEHKTEEIVAPRDGGLKLAVSGLTIKSPALAKSVCGEADWAGDTVIITEANIPDSSFPAFLREGYCTWLLR